MVMQPPIFLFVCHVPVSCVVVNVKLWTTPWPGTGDVYRSPPIARLSHYYPHIAQDAAAEAAGLVIGTSSVVMSQFAFEFMRRAVPHYCYKRKLQHSSSLPTCGIPSSTASRLSLLVDLITTSKVTMAEEASNELPAVPEQAPMSGEVAAADTAGEGRGQRRGGGRPRPRGGARERERRERAARRASAQVAAQD